jgi:hypothetical protein
VTAPPASTVTSLATPVPTTATGVMVTGSIKLPVEAVPSTPVSVTVEPKLAVTAAVEAVPTCPSGSCVRLHASNTATCPVPAVASISAFVETAAANVYVPPGTPEGDRSETSTL